MTNNFYLWRERLLTVLALLSVFFLPISTGLTSVFSVMFLVIWILTGAWIKDRFWWCRQINWLFPLVIILFLPCISLVWSIDPDPNYFKLLSKSYYFLLAIAICCLSFSEIKLKHFIISYIVGAELFIFFIVLSNLQIITANSIYDNFMVRGYITGSLLLVFATVLLSHWFRQKAATSFRICILVVVFINIYSLSMLPGRSGYLAFVVLSPLILANVFNLKGLRLISITVAVLILFFCVPQVQHRIILAVHEINNYSKGVNKVVLDSSTGIRLLYWEGGYEIFKRHPFIGVGVGGYTYAMRELYPQIDKKYLGNNPHNYYIYLIATYGLLGLALYGWLLFATVKKVWPYRTKWGGFAVITGIMVISIGNLTDTALLSQATGILFGFLIGIPVDK